VRGGAFIRETLSLVALTQAGRRSPRSARGFRLTGERGPRASRNDLVTLFSSGPPDSVRLARPRAAPSAVHLVHCGPLNHSDSSCLAPLLPRGAPRRAKVLFVIERLRLDAIVLLASGQRPQVRNLARPGQPRVRRQGPPPALDAAHLRGKRRALRPAFARANAGARHGRGKGSRGSRRVWAIRRAQLPWIVYPRVRDAGGDPRETMTRRGPR
jgi:hypothetical protein